MKELIELFFGSPSNKHQEIYKDYESEFISGENDPAYSRMKMRDQLQEWCNSYLDKYEMSVMISTCVFTVNYNGDDIEFSEPEKLVTIIEACKKDDFTAISEAVEQVN